MNSELFEQGWAEFDRRDLFAALAAAVVVASGSDGAGVLFLVALAARGLLWTVVDSARPFPAPRRLSPD